MYICGQASAAGHWFGGEPLKTGEQDGDRITPQRGRPNSTALGKEFAIIRAATSRMDTFPIRAVELIGDIDDQHHLRADVPKELPTGQVRVIVLLPEEDEAGARWARGIANEWSEDFADPHQDIYTLDDGQPLNAAG